ncbi:MAG TPA: hypothetical protein VIW92_10695 [Thermoanaerobaculia bacterium]
MSRLRSHLSPRLIVLLFVLTVGVSFFAFAATITPTSTERTDLGTTDQQEAVRTSREASLLPYRTSCPVVPAKELFITDVSVVEDCYRTTWNVPCKTPTAPATRGAWTFGANMAAVAGTSNPVQLHNFTLQWLQTWSVNQTINGDLVPARPDVQTLVINPWLAASGGTYLDLQKAPFRLLAIVARLDLRNNAGYSGGSSAGEGRFVYNLLDASGNPTQFLAIFEYGLDAKDCTGIMDWANAWHGLGAYAFGHSYNAALQSVTDRFATIGASPAKPNGSAINQVRTNDFHLDRPWELREFHLNAKIATGSPLAPFTVAQTPARSLHQTAAISTYVNGNEPAILAHSHIVPLSWGGNPFRGGASPHSLDLGWDGPPPACTSITNPQARHAFSLDTCSGCHGDETATFFKHVEPRLPGAASTLSTFLTGGSATDLCGLTHNFGDIERRRVDLCQLLEKSCTDIEKEPVVTFVH